MSVDVGYRQVTLRVGSLSGRIGVRTIVVALALAVAALAIWVVSLGLGDFYVAPADVIRTLLGNGSERTDLVVLDWRMPRALLALVLGAALGVSGAIFQSLTRNPLGSPDVIGFDVGAYTGVLLVIIATQGGSYQLNAIGAVIGGILTAVVVYLLAYRRGYQGFRLIIVGIGVAAVLTSVNTWLLINAQLWVAMEAAAWGAGSLNAVGWEQAVPASLAIAVLLVLAALLGPTMRVFEHGDDTARVLGVPLTRGRVALVLVAVSLTATVTAAAGPISFIALAAPQLARRLTRSAGVSLAASAAMGALLLAASDLAAQRVLAPTQLPVGIVTVAIGGSYLVWLLIREARR